MKNRKLKRLVGTFIVLMASMAAVSAQGWRSANNARNTTNVQNQTCLNYLSDLTEDQKTKITALEKSHQEAIAELRTERRSTVDAIEKNEIRGEMLKKVKAHRTAVKNLLTETQQKEYELLHARNNNFRNQQFQGNRGNRRGNNQGFGRGNRGNYGRNFNNCPRYFN